jgi:membrane protein DedA with SNARE-associated domain
MPGTLTHVVAHYGYASVLVAVFVEGMGLPSPGGIVLVAVAAEAATTQDLNIVVILVIATLSGIAGSLCGYWVAHRLGYRLLLHYGSSIGLTERRVKTAKYVCDTYGGLAVLCGRLVAPWIIPLVGVVGMAWDRVVPHVVGGSLIWTLLFGVGGYVLGTTMQRVQGPLGVLAAVAALGLVIRLSMIIGRNIKRLEDAADQAYPGPLRTPRSNAD